MKDAYINRKYVIMAVIALSALVLLVRLFIIQVVKETYRLSADNNVLRYVTQYPARGLIYDRNKKYIVYNQAAYDMMVVPAQVTRIDTATFCQLLEITTSSFRERMNAAISYSRRAPSVFLKQISAETYAGLQEKMFMFPGFYVQPRTLRKYSKPIAAHLLGYVSEVDEGIIRKDPYYKAGDYIGKLGIEEAYEKELRGRRGVKIYLVDVYSRIKGSYADGRLDTTAVQGKDIISTIDMDLQEYGEMLMRNKTGSIVALEPKTGEVLTLVSSPNYDPALLVGRVRSENFAKLSADTLNLPLFNRAIQAKYPPGSTFKPINGLIGLAEGVITPSTMFGCSNGYLFVGCHSHSSPLDLVHGISNSCNSYFCQTFRRILENPRYGSVSEAYTRWKEYLNEFGFGKKLGIELTNELPGLVPSPAYFDKYYGKNRWKALTVISMSIGQGEIETTPLQMANMVAMVVNNGVIYQPHLLKEIRDPVSGAIVKTIKPSVLHKSDIDSGVFQTVRDNMRSVITEGTARFPMNIKAVQVAGKTGTGEVGLSDRWHSWFAAYAPYNSDNPDDQIVVSIIVEASNSWEWWAPYASAIIFQGIFAQQTYEEAVKTLGLQYLMSPRERRE